MTRGMTRREKRVGGMREGRQGEWGGETRKGRKRGNDMGRN